MVRAFLALCATLGFLLAGCDDDSDSRPKPRATAPSSEGWTAEWSPETVIAGNVVAIPADPGVTGTITKRLSLAGKSTIRLRFTLDGSVTADELPESPATISLYFQRAGDDWTGNDDKEAYRWYCGTMPLVPGEHEITCRLDQLWTAVRVSSSESNPMMFAKAIEFAERVGFVLGGADGLAHGVHGPARLTIHSFGAE